MNLLLITMIGMMYTTHACAGLFQQALTENYSLVHSQNSFQKMDRSRFYAVEAEYQGSGIGLAKDLQLSSAWRGSFGIIYADDYVDMSTSRSMVSVQDRSIDMNQLLSAQVRVDFSDIMPFLSLSYQYRADEALLLDVTTSLKIFTVQSIDINLGNPLGEILQDIPQVSSALHRELNRHLQDIYVYPVFNVKFNYSFY